MTRTRTRRRTAPASGSAAASGGVRIQATAWRRLSAWADGSACNGGIGAQLFVAVTLVLGTVLCFGLRATLAACRLWLRRGAAPIALSLGGVSAAAER